MIDVAYSFIRRTSASTLQWSLSPHGFFERGMDECEERGLGQGRTRALKIIAGVFYPSYNRHSSPFSSLPLRIPSLIPPL